MSGLATTRSANVRDERDPAGCRRRSSRYPRARGSRATCPRRTAPVTTRNRDIRRSRFGARARRECSQLVSFSVINLAAIRERLQPSARALQSAPVRGMAASRAQELVARGHFDQRRKISSRRDRHANRRHLHAEHVFGLGIESEAGQPSRPASHRSNFTISSIRFDARVAETPNRSVTLIKPRPRISMWVARQARTGADQLGLRAAAPPPCRRRRDDARARPDRGAHSLLPMPLSPRIRTPRPRMSIEDAMHNLARRKLILEMDDKLRDRRRRRDRRARSSTPARSASASEVRRRREGPS